MSPTIQPRGHDALNVLVRAEMIAIEAYTLALRQFEDEAAIAELQKIRDDHSRAVRHLRDHVIDGGGHPAEGAAGKRTDATMAGPADALAALRNEEEDEIEEYEAILADARLHADCWQMIRSELLPACHRHVAELDRLLGELAR